MSSILIKIQNFLLQKQSDLYNYGVLNVYFKSTDNETLFRINKPFYTDEEISFWNEIFEQILNFGGKASLCTEEEWDFCGIVPGVGSDWIEINY